MSPEELWETTINPKNRKLIQFKIEEDKETQETFVVLMGTKIAPRRQFIMDNAKYANIDS